MSYVYFIQGGGTEGPIKIGYSANPMKRLLALQSASPVSLAILGIRPGTIQDERELHEKFAVARKHGEWFAPMPEILAEIPDYIPEGAYSTIGDALTPDQCRAAVKTHIYRFINSFPLEEPSRFDAYPEPIRVLKAVIHDAIYTRCARALLNSLTDLDDED